jgi:hypothetical protein
VRYDSTTTGFVGIGDHLRVETQPAPPAAAASLFTVFQSAVHGFPERADIDFARAWGVFCEFS